MKTLHHRAACGLGGKAPRPRPLPAMAHVILFGLYALNPGHAQADAVVTWGNNESEQIGDATVELIPEPAMRWVLAASSILILRKR